MNILLIIWLAVIALVIIIGLFWAGYDKTIPSWEKEDLIGGVLILAISWPLFLIMAVCAIPFYSIYWLGKWFGSRFK